MVNAFQFGSKAKPIRWETFANKKKESQELSSELRLRSAQVENAIVSGLRIRPFDWVLFTILTIVYA